MFPYPSGTGLHVGHPEGYTATDIVARYRKMRGDNVLHPMGWDAFGLPAEQYAIKTGQHPRATTAGQRRASFKQQLIRLGFNYDWEREVNTTDPAYFRWTQWIFGILYNSWFNPATRRAEPIETYPGEDRRWRAARLRRGGARQLVRRPRDRAGERGGGRRQERDRRDTRSNAGRCGNGCCASPLTRSG